MQKIYRQGDVLITKVDELPGGERESVKPGINDSFETPNTEQFTGRFERDGREPYDRREEIIQACQLRPGMILAETALSFLGLGLRPPIVSWGVLLKEAQNIRSVATAPWLLLPGVAVIIAVLALNFLGDGLRDAADPYGR